LKLVDSPATNPTGASELRFAVAIHEAGHAVAFAGVGIDVLSVRISSSSNPSRNTQSGEIVAAGRPDFLATLYAGDIAVEELCGGYRLPIVQSPASDQEQLRRSELKLGIADNERTRAQARARQIVQTWNQLVVALANALLAAPDGRLRGTDLDNQLAPIREQFTA
jgi:hypothetical protein